MATPKPRKIVPCAVEADIRLIERVRQQFRDPGADVPTLREIASALALSPRTLRRRLMALGTCYSEILREERFQRAADWLAETSWTVDVIAERLGYTETTNFRRAFRRWIGCPPYAFRRALRDEAKPALDQAA